MEPRAYTPPDRSGCLTVFDSNALEGRNGFEQFLDRGPANFTVLEHEGGIVGCGGYMIDARARSATLHHGMIRKDVQRMGLGRFLLLYRLRQITQSGLDIQHARLDTKPTAAGFYVKQGFKPFSPARESVVELVMKLTVCA